MRVITTSLLKAFLNCPVEAYYMEQGLQKPQKPGSPLSRGSFIHELLDKGEAPIPIEGLFDEERALYEEYQHLVEAYRFNWRDAEWKRLRSEFKLSRKIAPDVCYQGKVDELVLINGKVWLVDHKTHMQLPTTEFRLLDIQSDAYIWLLTPWLKKHGMLDGTGRYQFGGFVWDYLVMGKIKTPQLVVAGNRFKRVKGDELPFTDYTTLRRVLIETGCAEERGNNQLVFTDKLDEAERKNIAGKLSQLALRPCDAFQRYFVPFDEEQHARQVALIKKACAAFLKFDFTARPILRNPLLCGNSYLCSFDKLAVAELATGDDSAMRGQFIQVDPLARYNEDNEGDN